MECDDYEEEIEISPQLYPMIKQLHTKYKNITIPEQTTKINNILFSQVSANLSLLTLLIEFGETVTKIFYSSI